MRALLLAAALGLAASSSFAGKADDIVAACGGKASKKEAADKIKSVYLQCNPGTKVKVNNDCEIDCQKSNDGAKIGG